MSNGRLPEKKLQHVRKRRPNTVQDKHHVSRPYHHQYPNDRIVFWCIFISYALGRFILFALERAVLVENRAVVLCSWHAHFSCSII